MRVVMTSNPEQFERHIDHVAQTELRPANFLPSPERHFARNVHDRRSHGVAKPDEHFEIEQPSGEKRIAEQHRHHFDAKQLRPTLRVVDFESQNGARQRGEKAADSPNWMP